MRIALITGASSGLGKEFIRQLRREKLDEIWAIARRKERLLELSGLVPIPVRPMIRWNACWQKRSRISIF